MRTLRPTLRLPAIGLSVTLGASLFLTACLGTPDNNTAARYVPGNAEGFATVALAPSVEQQAKLLALSTRLPDDVHADKADEVVGKMINDLVKDEGLTYDADIKPWLGSEAAVALLRPVDDAKVPLAVGYFKVEDEAKAKATLDKKNVEPATYRFLKNYLVIIDKSEFDAHDGAKALDTIEALTKDGGDKANSLQNADRYKKSLDSLHGEHLALGWFDVPALLETSDVKEEAAASFSGAGAYVDKFNKIGAIATELYATTDSIVTQIVTENPIPDSEKTTAANLLKGLPADTLLAVDVADVSSIVTDAQKDTQTDAAQADIDSDAGADALTVLPGTGGLSAATTVGTPGGKALKTLLGTLTGEGVLAVTPAAKLGPVL